MNDYRAYVESDYNSIYHFGIKGQKWGIRRYQNPDGSLTPEGKKRYLNPDGSLNERGRRELSRGYLKDRKYAGRIAGGALGTAAAAYYAKEMTTGTAKTQRAIAEINKMHPAKQMLARADFRKNGIEKTAKSVEEVAKLQKEGWVESPANFKIYEKVKNPIAEEKIGNLLKNEKTRSKKIVAAALAAGIGATAVSLYIHHKGVQKRKAEVEKMLMGADNSDSSATKRVKEDWKNMSDEEFKTKYKTTKDTYAKRVAKYGDPYMKSPLAKLGKSLSKRKKIENQKGFTSGAPSLKDIQAQQNKQGRAPSIRETVEKQNSIGRAPHDSFLSSTVFEHFDTANKKATSLGGNYYVDYDENLGVYLVRKKR